MKITSTKYHDEKSKTYDKSYNEPFWRFYNDITWSYIEKCLPKDIDNSLVLDAGGGTGLWSIKIAKMGYNVILSDVSSGMLKIAEEKIKDQNLNGKIKKGMYEVHLQYSYTLKEVAAYIGLHYTYS